MMKAMSGHLRFRYLKCIDPLYSDVVSVADTIFVVWQDERPENGSFSVYFSKSTGHRFKLERRILLGWRSFWLDVSVHRSFDNRIYVVWSDGRCDPDLQCSAVYFTRYDPEPDIIGDDDKNNEPENWECFNLSQSV